MTDAEKAAAEAKAASDAKAKADADAKSKVDAAAKEKGKQGDDDRSDADDAGGELAGVFDGDDKGKKSEEPAPKGGELKLSIPKEVAPLVGDGKDYLAAAREAGLSQQQLDRFMSVQFDRVKAAAQEADQQREKMFLETRRALAGDRELGGVKLKETMLVAERGARALGGSVLAAKLARHLTGEEVMDGASLVRAFHMAGLELKEDRLGGDTKKPTPQDEDANLTPQEREFKRMHPESWRRMQAEKTAGKR